MDRNLLLLILSLTCFYFILDEFVGQKRISNLIAAGGVTSEGTAPLPAPEPFNPDEAAPDTVPPKLAASDLLNPNQQHEKGIYV